MGSPSRRLLCTAATVCCPFKKSESTKTDHNGLFQLEKLGPVIHAYKQGLGSRTEVIKPGQSEVNLILEPLTSGTVAPECENPRQGYRRIGGKYGVQFDVPEPIAEVRGGKPDVDYVRYGVKRKGNNSEKFLELWFGAYAISIDPDDDLLINSVTFQQRAIVAANGHSLGLDSWGHLRDGTYWRQIFVSGEGAIYKQASDDDAGFFNQIMNTFCVIPYPAH